MRYFLALSFALITSVSFAAAEWRRGSELPTAVPDAVAAEMDGKLFVMSGKVGQGFRSFFEQYDLANDGWRPLTPMPVALSQFALTAGTGRVFVTGGRDNRNAKITDDFWMYAPDTAIWLELGNLPSPRADHISVFDGQRLFLFGGIGRDAARVQSYNMQTGKWSNWKNPMPVAVSAAAATLYGDEVILAGGQDQRGRPVKNVQAFNLKTGTWRQLPALPLAVTGGAFGVLQDGLHFAGGFSQSQGKVLDSHNRLVGQRWQRREPMPAGGRHRMAYHAGDGQFTLIGGAIGGGFYAMFTPSNRVSIYRP